MAEAGGSGMIAQDLSDDQVMTVTFNRPDKKNALTDAMYRDVVSALALAETREDVGAVVITGAGGAFTAGNDLKDFAAMGGADDPSRSGAAALLRALADATVPIVAAVEGPAVGIGVTMLLHLDAVYAAPDAKFATPFVDLGLCAEGAASLLGPALLTRGAVTRLLLMGETLDAGQAMSAGLIDDVTLAPGRMAREAARVLGAKPRRAVRETKRLIRDARHEAVRAAIDRELVAFGERLRSEEAREAIGRFLLNR